MIDLKDKGTIQSKRVIHIAQDLSYNGALDVVVYDVRRKTPYVSYYIVATSKNERHLNSLVKVASDSIYDNYKVLDHKEGKKDSKWILLDCKDVVIQLFTNEIRSEVEFDKLYSSCPHKVVEAYSEPIYRKKKRFTIKWIY